MKFTKILKITALIAAVAGCVGLKAVGQETRYGLSAYSTSGTNWPAGTLSNIAIIPQTSWVKNPDPMIVGAVPTVTFLDANVTVADGGTPNIVVFMSTNQSSVYAGNDASANPRTQLNGCTNGNYYGKNSPGTGSNAYWLNGPVTGIITNQFVVIQHQGVLPEQVEFECAVIQSNNTVYWTNSFTNGQQQVTTITNTNSVITLNTGTSAVRSVINAGDQIWFQVTNQVIYVGSNSVYGQRLTMSNPAGVITGQRFKPLMFLSEGSNIVVNINAVYLP